MNEQRDEDGSKARGATAQGGAGHDLGSGCRLANDPRRSRWHGDAATYSRRLDEGDGLRRDPGVAVGWSTAAFECGQQRSWVWCSSKVQVREVPGTGWCNARNVSSRRECRAQGGATYVTRRGRVKLERGSSGADVVGGGERWWEVSSASLDVSRRRDAKFLGSNPSAAVRRRWMCGAFIMRGVRLRGRRCQRMWCVRREPGFRACSSASGSAPRYASPGSQKSRAETYLREVVGGKARPVASFDARESLEERHDVGRIWHWPNATSLDAFGSRWTRFTGWGDTGDVVGGVRRSSTSLDARGTW
ncbi:hypothetical protein DFP72DRAFT_851422 [Ephemerocybe angulata]|uniref:Uncharacterized protein n=1 Tax=Ephemerocybe angulata TaxID=980116 RepID=A0A8H6HQR6_9AGAR|nr:hypothetical protein DFP72DRAFT_851422 [Tulosesus angulatus]